MSSHVPAFDVCVVGLGHVGLPLAALLAASLGLRVLGVDVDEAHLEALGQGRVSLHEPGLVELLRQALEQGTLTLSARPAPAQVVVFATPTLMPEQDERQGQQALDAALSGAIEVLAPQALLIVEATASPGTTRARVVSPLQAAGLRVGQDVFVAHCPERVLPGQILHELVHDARALAGATPACAERALAFYARFVQGPLRALSSLEAAEATKLIENASREVQIALANELTDWAQAQGLDPHELLEAASTHPRVRLLSPGVGVGGRCLPLASSLLVRADARGDLGLVRRARALHDALPERLAGQILALLPRGASVALLGVCYKPDVADWRSSPLIALLFALERAVGVQVHDPYITQWPYGPLCQTWSEAVQGADAVIVGVGHQVYRALAPEALDALTRGRMMIDLGRALKAEPFERAGWDYRCRGRGLGSPT